MDIETPFKEGFLLFPPQGILKKKAWHKKYCKLFKSSKHGIERLEVFETEEDAWKNKSTTIITLENCVKISPTPQKHQNHVFTVVTKSAVQDFSTLFDLEMQDWIAAFQAVAFKDDASGSGQLEELEEDNDLYCSSGEGIFTVRVVPTQTSMRCGLIDGNYTLVVTPSALQLRAPYPQERVLFTWPFMYIRRYGYRSGHFTFEAGRKCDSGEGTFQLENSHQQEIFKCISMRMKAWKSRSKDDVPMTPPAVPLPSPPMIQCGDGQFQAALSMEPGSRTPLPPSPTSATSSLFSDLSSVMENVHIAKLKPVKPPRNKVLRGLSQDVIDPMLLKKLLPEQIDEDSQSQSYDAVLIRQDAWKTMGLNDLPHTEIIHSNEENIRLKVSKSNSLSEETPQKSRKIITQPSVDSAENYDTLQHFGGAHQSVSKSNSLSKCSSQYRQITPLVPAPAPASYDNSWNEYEVIQENLQEAVRPADDSHQGYGMIRKAGASNPSPPAQPAVTSDLEYAVVVKAKK